MLWASRSTTHAQARQVVMELAAQVVDVLLLLEVREHAIEEKEPRALGGDGTAERRQIMQLAERAGEGRLAALVRSGHDDDALAATENIVVGDDLLPGVDELPSQREIVGPRHRFRLAVRRQLRKTDREARFLEPAHMGKIRNGKLDLPVEP